MGNKIGQGGWVKIQGAHLVLAINRAGIRTDGMRFSSHVTYAPRWVRDAIQLYEQNPDYAGLELSEFLRKMNPECDSER